MTDKEQYRELCEAEGSKIPLFQQYWWMETVCEGKRWDVLLSKRQGRIEGALPYLHGSRLGLRYILQPQLTRFSGPWYNNESHDLNFEMRVGTDLAQRLKALGVSVYIQHFSPEVTNWLPFRWEGFSQTTRYTYRFPSLANPDDLFRKASRVRRRHMDEVEASCSVDRHLSPEEFAPFHADYYRRRGEKDQISNTLLLNVTQKALQRQQGMLWGLRDREGGLQAGWFVAFDSRCAYSLLLAIGRQAPPNAMTYLMWQMLNELSHHTQAFDFEGSIEPGLERFYRSFGTCQTPYFEVSLFKPKVLQHFFR
ncbi:MAG: hypothetical protein IJ745_01415 [Bacteroidales bacterium]|nr:hypothetical protein [Bacteroidales bacterium]